MVVGWVFKADGVEVVATEAGAELAAKQLLHIGAADGQCAKFKVDDVGLEADEFGIEVKLFDNGAAETGPATTQITAGGTGGVEEGT
jgi:hypothetical protein